MRQDHNKPSLLVNVLSNWTAQGVGVLIKFFLTPFVLYYLGKTGYGIWILAGTLIGYYGFLDLGITSATMRYIAYYAGKKDYDGVHETINISLLIFSLIGLVVVILSFIFATRFAGFFKVTGDQLREFSTVFWLFGLAAGISFPGNMFNAALRAYEHFAPGNAVEIATALLKAGLTIYVLSSGFGMVGLAYANLVGTVLAIALRVFLCYYLIDYFRLSLVRFRWPVIRPLLTYGATTMVIILSDTLRFNVDNIVIGRCVDVAAVTIFALAYLPVNQILGLVSSFTNVFGPRFTFLEGRGETEQLRRLFLKSLSISAIISFAAASLLLFLGRPFILLWVGPNFLDAVPILSVLAVAFAFALAQGPGITAMFALNKHRYFAVVSIVEGIVNLVLSLILVRRYGIMGVALGTAIPMLIVKIAVQPVYVSRIVGVSLGRYWAEMTPPLALAVGLVAVSRLLPPLGICGQGYLSLVALALPFLGAFALLYILTGKLHKRFISD